ncbi:hypothetical protein GOBAR_AA37885 [Gossypium barbadense]|uniref:Uncharacterized protein n=1 Tax=Gossypium barbadense TaxID=3634 RepID=A0A2P5VVG2_GOSBA|nr:hypothetical protein GOBAR_AA37885 [Gossypium barbadense]
MTLCSAAPADSCDIMGCSRLHHLHLQAKAAQLRFLFREKLWCPMMESTSTQEVIQLTNQQVVQGSIPYINSAITAWVAVLLVNLIRLQSAEVSDQNLVDEDQGKKTSNIRCKKLEDDGSSRCFEPRSTSMEVDAGSLDPGPRVDQEQCCWNWSLGLGNDWCAG